MLKKTCKIGGGILAALVLAVISLQAKPAQASDGSFTYYLDYTTGSIAWNYYRANSASVPQGSFIYVRMNTMWNFYGGCWQGYCTGSGAAPSTVVQWHFTGCPPGATCMIYTQHDPDPSYLTWNIVSNYYYQPYVWVQLSASTPPGTYYLTTSVIEYPIACQQTPDGACLAPQTQTFAITVTGPPTATLTGSGWNYSNSAGPLVLPYGAGFSLNWSSANASSCTLDGSAVATNGTYNTSSPNYPANGWSHTYNLTCSGAGGSVTKYITASVPPNPSNVSATCVANGNGTDTLTVNWNLPGGYSYAYVRAQDTLGNFVYPPTQDGVAGASLSGTTGIVPGRTYNFWVHTDDTGHYGAYSDPIGSPWGTALNGAVTCPNPGPAPSLTVNTAFGSTSNGGSIYTHGYNDTPTLNWSAPNATSCTLTSNNGDSLSGISGSATARSLGNDSGSGHTWTYTLSCSGPGGSASQSVNVLIPPAPTGLVANCPAPGTAATLYWTAPSGWTNFYVRNDDTTAGTHLAWNENYAGTTYNIPNSYPGLEYPGSPTVGHNYSMWIHSRAANGAYSMAAGVNYSCVNPGVCGPAATPPSPTYAPAATSYAGAYCSGGTASANPAFPNAGQSSSWTCTGTSSANCTASRSCVTVSFRPATSGTSLSSTGPSQSTTLNVNPGQTFYAFCDYGNTSNSIGVSVPGVSCAWDNAWIGTATRFKCTAPNSPGNTYSMNCTTNTGGVLDACTANNNAAGSVKVAYGAPGGITVAPQCSASNVPQNYIQWSAGNGASAYNIYRNTSNSIPASPSYSNISALSYTDNTNVVSGTQYYYWVESVGGDGTKVSASSNPVTANTCIVPPSSPSSLSGDNSTCAQMKLTWTSSANATGYNLYRYQGSSLPNGFNPASQATVVSFNANSPYYDYSLGDNSPYYYWVSAYNGGGTSPVTQMTNSPITTKACIADLTTEKDIVAINGSPLSNTPYGYMNGGTDALPGLGVGTLNLGDTLTFSLNLRNQGNKAAKLTTVSDGLINLVAPSSGWNAKYQGMPLTYDGTQPDGSTSCTPAAPGHYCAYGNQLTQTLVFNLATSTYDVAAPVSPASEVDRSITFAAKLSVPVGYTGTAPRFQNCFVTSYYKSDSSLVATGNVCTPVMPFTTELKGPIMVEEP